MNSTETEQRSMDFGLYDGAVFVDDSSNGGYRYRTCRSCMKRQNSTTKSRVPYFGQQQTESDRVVHWY